VTRLRADGLVVCAVILTVFALVPSAQATTNTRGFWYLYNSNNCGGSCHLRGTEAAVSSPFGFNLETAEYGDWSVNGFATNSSFAQAGQIRMHSSLTTCGGTNSTNGVNRGFDSSLDACFLEGTPPSGEVHVYRDQRKNDNTCASGHTPYCAAIYIDGSRKQEILWGTSEFNDQISAGANIDPAGNSDGLEGDFGLNGTMRWSRTSDVHTPGQSDTTWTTVGSAICQSDHLLSSSDWFVGSLASGFNVHFDLGGTGCPG
jgi:hypothetical protein